MSTNKSTLFIDFDGVKFPTLISHMLYLNEKYNITSVPSDYQNNLGLPELIRKYRPGIDISDDTFWLDFQKNFLESIDHHDPIPPMDGMCDAVSLLSQKYELWIVTARHKGSIKVINHMIKKYIPDCISGIHCVYGKKVGEGGFIHQSKRSFIEAFPGKKIGFIDDNPGEIENVQDIIPAYLFDPERQNEHREEILRRVYGWEHVKEIFL